MPKSTTVLDLPNVGNEKQAADAAWEFATIGELAADEPDAITDGPFGSKLKTAHYTDEGPRVIRLQNIGDGFFKDARAHVSPEHFAALRKHHVFAGDLVIAALGESPPRSCIIPEWLGPALVKADCIRFKAGPRVLPAYLNYALNSPFLKRQGKMIVHGVGRPRLNLKEIKSLKIPLPPLDEQRRIVEEIEQQFTRLDAGVAALRSAQIKLKRYRAAVLKAACEGKLVPTEAELARKEGRSCETGEELLQRILAEKGKKWAGRAKYKEPDAPHVADLGELPEGWTWATVAQVGEVTTGFTPPGGNGGFFGGCIPFFKPTDLDAGYYVRKFRDSLTDAGAEHGRILPEGSVLVTCIGATIGKTGFARVRCATNQQINALTVEKGFVSPEFAFWMFSSPFGQQQITENASATTLPILNKSKFQALAIPLPPLVEQARIVTEVERLLSVVEELEAVVSANFHRAIRLRQCFLQNAFNTQC